MTNIYVYVRIYINFGFKCMYIKYVRMYEFMYVYVCSSYWDYRNHSFQHEGNTGLYFVRSNPKTVDLFGQVIASISRLDLHKVTLLL